MVDWASVITRIQQHHRLSDIAAACDMSEPWVSQLRSGRIKQPGYEQGVRLLKLAEQCGHPYDPKVEPRLNG